MLTVKAITIMEIKQMKYEKQASKEEHIKDDITLPKIIKDIEVMGRSFRREIVQMIECIIN